MLLLNRDSIELIKGYTNSWSLSIAITTSMIRMSQLPIYWIVKRINFIESKFFKKWIYNIFINDLHIDAKRHRMEDKDKKYFLTYYESSRIISWLYQVYLS
jgi:hypothetical protein